MSGADGLAVLRAIAVVPIAWLVLAGQRDAALAMFVAASLTDALDGWLARRTSSLGPRGAYLDPLADKILVVGTLVALSATGVGWPVTLVTLAAIVREGVVLVLRTRAMRRGAAQPADRIAKAKTVAEMVGIALIIVGGRPWAVLGAALVGLAVLVGIATIPRYLAK